MTSSGMDSNSYTVIFNFILHFSEIHQKYPFPLSVFLSDDQEYIQQKKHFVAINAAIVFFVFNAETLGETPTVLCMSL